MTARTIRTPADIKGMVEGGKLVNFIHFQGGSLWYATECGFEFPVSLEEIGETTYPAQDKALLFMRFIRKHIQMIQTSLGEAPQAQESRALAPPPCL